MIPILYDSLLKRFNAEKSYSQGLGRLSDATKCAVTEELNGEYELTMDLPENGRLADRIGPRSLIGAIPNARDDLQLFRVYNVTREMRGMLHVQAKHISGDLSDFHCYIFHTVSGHIEDALAQFESNIAYRGPRFTFAGDSGAVRPGWGIDVPASARSIMGGMEGSIIDSYGGEWEYDNWRCDLIPQRGVDLGFEIRPGKNVTSMVIEQTDDGGYTDIYPYYTYTDGDIQRVIAEREILNLAKANYRKTYVLDTTEHFGSEVPYYAQIRAYAFEYAAANKLTNNKQSLKVGLATIRDVSGNVGLGDTVYVVYGRERIQTRIWKATWNVLTEQYDAISVGDKSETITQTIRKIKAR